MITYRVDHYDWEGCDVYGCVPMVSDNFHDYYDCIEFAENLDWSRGVGDDPVITILRDGSPVAEITDLQFFRDLTSF